MDIRMPELDGLTATEQILRQAEPPTIVVLTTFGPERVHLPRTPRRGRRLPPQDAPSSRLIAAVRAAATGDSLIEPSITQRLVERFAEPAVAAGIPAELARLTERELDVLRLIGRGLSNAEIATEMVVAETTVKTHVARILSKLGSAIASKRSWSPTKRASCGAAVPERRHDRSRCERHVVSLDRPRRMFGMFGMLGPERNGMLSGGCPLSRQRPRAAEEPVQACCCQPPTERLQRSSCMASAKPTAALLGETALSCSSRRSRRCPATS